jgi:hypothetical protein
MEIQHTLETGKDTGSKLNRPIRQLCNPVPFSFSDNSLISASVAVELCGTGAASSSKLCGSICSRVELNRTEGEPAGFAEASMVECSAFMAAANGFRQHGCALRGYNDM